MIHFSPSGEQYNHWSLLSLKSHTKTISPHEGGRQIHLFIISLKYLQSIMALLDYNRRTGDNYMLVTLWWWQFYDAGGRIIVVIHKLTLFRSPTFLSRLQQLLPASMLPVRWFEQATVDIKSWTTLGRIMNHWIVRFFRRRSSCLTFNRRAKFTMKRSIGSNWTSSIEKFDYAIKIKLNYSISVKSGTCGRISNFT